MKNVKVLLVTMFSFSTGWLSSQTSVVQDSKGETNLVFGSGGVVALNAADESISFSYGRPTTTIPPEKPETYHYHYIGIKGKGKGKSGLSNVTKNGEFQYDGSLGAFYFYDIRTPNGFWQPNASFDISFSQFKILDTSLEVSAQLKDYNSKGAKITLGINRIYTGWNLPVIWGANLSMGLKNNSSDLKQAIVSSFQTRVDTASSQMFILQKDQSTAYVTSEFKDELLSSNFNFDMGTTFFDQYMLLLSLRHSVQADRAPQFNPALGLYFTREGAPLEVVAGIQWQINDLFNTAGSKKSTMKRALLNVVAGFVF